jgi:hypothetical protein
MSTVIRTVIHTVSACAVCGALLTRYEGVTRRYTGVSEGRECVVSGLGHYTFEGCYEPDRVVDLPDCAQTVNGDDSCTVCGHVVG